MKFRKIERLKEHLAVTEGSLINILGIQKEQLTAYQTGELPIPSKLSRLIDDLNNEIGSREKWKAGHPMHP